MPDQEWGDFQNRDLYALSVVLAAAVRKLLFDKGALVLSEEPKIVEQKIIQFGHRMRVDGLAKFSERTVFSSVVFYLSRSDMEKNRAIGNLIFYIPVGYISKLLWIMDYPRIDEDDDPSVLDGCGTITNLVAGYFVKELCGHGYIHLEMSHFESFINSAVNGVEFSSVETFRHDISFSIRGEKRFVAELTMGSVPHF